jgi:hypothetical protein
MTNLCEAINHLVEKRLRRALMSGEVINVSDIASQMAESLADLIVCSAPSKERPRLVAHVLTELNRFLVENREAGIGAQLQ